MPCGDGRPHASSSAVMVVPIDTEPTFTAGTPEVVFEAPHRFRNSRDYDIDPGRQRFRKDILTMQVDASPLILFATVHLLNASQRKEAGRAPSFRPAKARTVASSGLPESAVGYEGMEVDGRVERPSRLAQEPICTGDHDSRLSHYGNPGVQWGLVHSANDTAIPAPTKTVPSVRFSTGHPAGCFSTLLRAWSKGGVQFRSAVR